MTRRIAMPSALAALFLLLALPLGADILFLNDGSEIRGKLEAIGPDGVRFHDVEKGRSAFADGKVLKIQFLSKKKLAGEETIGDIRHPDLRGWIANPPKEADHPGAGHVDLLVERTLTLADDGSSTWDVRVMQLLLKERGLDEANVSFPYLPPVEKGEILFARSISEGKIHYLDDTSIKEASVNSMAPDYDRLRSIKFAIPNAVVGAILDYAYRIRSSRHDAAHPLCRKVLFRSQAPLLKSRLTVRVPRGTKLVTELHNVDGPLFAKKPAFVRSDEGKETVYRLMVENVPPTIPEVAMAPWWRELPWAAVCAAGSWEDLRPAVRTAMDEAGKLPAELANLVRRFKKKHRAAALADALFAEIAREVKFVAVPASSYSPFPTAIAEVWKRRKGNNLDKPFLLWSLFRKAGLKADLIWVATKGFTPVLETLPALDDAIGAVIRLPGRGKAKDRWYVPWQDTLGPDELPASIQGTRGFTPFGREALVELPLLAPMDEATVSEKKLVLEGDGSFVVEELLKPTGENRRAYRAFRDLQQKARDKALENLVGAIDGKASLASYAFENLDDLTRPLSLKLAYRIPDAAIRGGDRLLVFRVPGTYFDDNRLTAKSERVNLMWFDGRSGLDVTARIDLPTGFRLRFVPDPLSIDTPRLTCRIAYARSQGRLELTLRYERKVTELAPADYAAFRSSLVRIREYLDQFIVLER